jgi:hypothetical protein
LLTWFVTSFFDCFNDLGGIRRGWHGQTHLRPGPPPERFRISYFGTLGEAWERAVEIVTGLLGWSFRYFVLGAVLVVPLWIVWRVIRATGCER